MQPDSTSLSHSLAVGCCGQSWAVHSVAPPAAYLLVVCVPGAQVGEIFIPSTHFCVVTATPPAPCPHSSDGCSNAGCRQGDQEPQVLTRLLALHCSCHDAHCSCSPSSSSSPLGWVTYSCAPLPRLARAHFVYKYAPCRIQGIIFASLFNVVISLLVSKVNCSPCSHNVQTTEP